MPGHGEKLSRKHEAAIAALLSEPTVGKAAAKVGVNERTLRRWQLDPAFAAAYRLARQQLVESATAAMQKAADQAVQTLAKNLKAKRPSDQIRAAVAVYDRATKAVELGDLVARIEALEAADKAGADES
jgi:hypothetical protein